MAKLTIQSSFDRSIIMIRQFYDSLQYNTDKELEEEYDYLFGKD